MHDPRLSALFLRYRREGDLAALAKLFDEISPEMMRVARHVASRGIDPEDVVQATFLASIERSDAFDAERPIVPWLMGILINQARLMNRRRATRHEEPAAQDFAAHDYEPEAAEAHEVQDAVARALEGLPATYRDVLVAHLAEGKPPHEIARDLGRPQGTVRAQLHRGLRIVRRSLPAGFALGVAAMLDRSALAEVRHEVLEFAARAKSLPPSAIPTGTATATSKLSLSVAVASVVLASVVLVAWLGGGSAHADPDLALRQPDPEARNRAAEVARLPARGRAAAGVTEAAVPATPVDAQRAEFVAEGTLRVIVRAASGEVVPAVHVDLFAWGDPLWHERTRALVTDAQGVAEFRRVPVGRVGVHLDGGGVQSRADVVVGPPVELEIVLKRGLDLSGTVVDPHGNPVEGAVVEVGEDPSLDPRRVSTPTGPDGRFRIDDVERVLAVWVRADSRAPSETLWFGTPNWMRCEVADIQFVIGDPVDVLQFEVVDARGLPVRGAIATAIARDDGKPSFRPDGTLVLPSGAARAHASELGVVRLAVDHARIDRIVVSAPGHAPRELALEDVGTLVSLAEPARLAGVAHFVDGAIGEAVLVEARVTGLREPLRVRAGVDGAWEIVDVPPGPFFLRCQAAPEAVPTETRGIATAGATFAWDPLLQHASVIRGVARSANGAPAKTWLVKAVREDANEPALIDMWLDARASAWRGHKLRQAWTDPVDGTFTVPCVDGLTYRLELRARAAWNGSVHAAVDGVRSGACDVELSVRTRGGLVRARFVDAAGRPTVGSLSAVRHHSGAEHVSEAGSDGRIERDLYPGLYTLVAWPAVGAPYSLGEHVVESDQLLDLGDLHADATGTLVVRGATDAGFTLRGVGGIAYHAVRSGDVWVARGLPLGEYAATGERADGGAFDARVAVTRGASAEIDLR